MTNFSHLKENIFKSIVKNTPLVSIDFLVKRDNKYLLGKRVNSPAKGYYFTIGGRIFKNEPIKEAQERILKEELNFSFDSTQNCFLKFIGVFEHFYEDSIFGDEISTHYVNLAYLIDFDRIAEEKSVFNDMPFDQHSDYIWLSKEEISSNVYVHKYVKEYFNRSEYV